MTLKINYLDNKKGSIKNKAIFVQLDTKISAFKGNFDHSISQKILNFFEIIFLCKSYKYKKKGKYYS